MGLGNQIPAMDAAGIDINVVRLSPMIFSYHLKASVSREFSRFEQRDGSAHRRPSGSLGPPKVHAEAVGRELYALQKDDDRRVMIENWEPADALPTHSRSPAVLEVGPELKGKLTGSIDLRVFEPHPAGNATLGAL